MKSERKVFLKVLCCRPLILYLKFLNITHSVSTLMIQPQVGDFINRPPMVFQLLRNRILLKSDLSLR
jgi:hypothetical protein